MSETETRAGMPGRILVVDDIDQNRKLASAQLTSAGYEVTTTSSGAEALATFDAARPDLVLLDVLMPEMDGFETCRRLRAKPTGRDVPVVFLTALTDLGSHEQALASGADDFLTKPLNRTELLIRVRSLLWVARLRDELRAGYNLIRSQRDALLLLQRQKDELAAFLVHDMKNPLTTVMVTARMMVSGVMQPSELGEWAGEILDAAEGMHRMVMNLLDISRSEDGVLVADRVGIDVAKFVHEVGAAAYRQAMLRRQTLRFEVASAPEVVYLDRDLVRRLIENLLDNAMRHAPSGSEVRVTVAGIADDEATQHAGLELRVTDLGPGVADEHKAYIFDKYARIGGEADCGRTSRGLGLTFCRLATEAHGGRVWVEDNVPRGSVFCAMIPGGSPPEAP